MNFIHFGCWNNGNCDTTKSESNLSQVMKKISDFTKKNPVKFAVIAGDNYYSTKVKEKSKDKVKEEKVKEAKVKIFNNKNFTSGIECLKTSLPEIKKYILLGNHEYDKVSGDDIDDNTNCNLMRLQQKTFKSEEKFNFFTDVMTEKSDNTLIIMIDTTLYEYKDNIADDYCNEVFPIITSRTYETLKTHQEKQVKELLEKEENKDKKNIIIIGHHPIITVKLKKNKETGKEEDKIENLDELIQLFKNISSLLENKNIYYLCADNHLRQEGIITFDNLTINQYVSGTGGAELDNCVEPKIVKNGDLTYDIKLCNSIHGFYYVTENSDKLQFHFEQADPIVTQNGGYKEKYLKYKAKYLNLKKSI
jgi:hypothetical protein